MPQASQPLPQFDVPFTHPDTGALAVPWQYLFNWIYGQLGGTSGASATGLFLSPPAHTGSTGRPGQIAFDAGFLYVCVATNSWKRVALLGGF